MNPPHSKPQPAERAADPKARKENKNSWSINIDNRGRATAERATGFVMAGVLFG
jgi:hypothetical protein